MTKIPSFRTLILGATFACVVAGSTISAQAANKLNDACSLFQQKVGWYTITSEASEKWGVPVSVILAIMHQESRFKSTAAAKTTSAFGYSQALTGTWEEYRAATSTTHAVRTSLTDSADFIGWYMNRTKQKLGLPLDDVAAHYLTYHEGPAGYQSKRWKKQPKLVQIAKGVAERARMYEAQLQQCRPSKNIVFAIKFPQPVGKPSRNATVRKIKAVPARFRTVGRVSRQTTLRQLVD